MKKKLLFSVFLFFTVLGLRAQCPPTPTPSICMVSCDGSSVNNIIYWDKTGYTHVDSFIVYREVSPSVYKKIAAVSNDSLSEYVDTTRSVGPANGDPNIASYRYKIQIRDSCGNFGGLSPYHNTIYIVDAGSGQFDWSIPYSIEGAPNPVTNYVLLCDTLGVNIWTPSATVSGTASTAVDTAFANHSTIANWRVKTAWSITCTPTRATVNTTRSNIKHAASITTGILNHTEGVVVIFPNSASNSVNIKISPNIKSSTIKIENIVGQVVHSEFIESSGTSGMTKQVDISAYTKGVYFISVDSKVAKVVKKLIIN